MWTMLLRAGTFWRSEVFLDFAYGRTRNWFLVGILIVEYNIYLIK